MRAKSQMRDEATDPFCLIILSFRLRKATIKLVVVVSRGLTPRLEKIAWKSLSTSWFRWQLVVAPLSSSSEGGSILLLGIRAADPTARDCEPEPRPITMRSYRALVLPGTERLMTEAKVVSKRLDVTQRQHFPAGRPFRQPQSPPSLRPDLPRAAERHNDCCNLPPRARGDLFRDRHRSERKLFLGENLYDGHSVLGCGTERREVCQPPRSTPMLDQSIRDDSWLQSQRRCGGYPSHPFRSATDSRRVHSHHRHPLSDPRRGPANRAHQRTQCRGWNRRARSRRVGLSFASHVTVQQFRPFDTDKVGSTFVRDGLSQQSFPEPGGP